MFIDQVTWINPDGDQIWKLSSDQIGVLRSVPQRPYFKAVRGGHLPGTRPRPSPSSWPPTARSRTALYTFLSIPSKLDEACVTLKTKATRGKDSAPAKGYVAVASTRLLSLEHPALPIGYGFAVVTRDGRTLYHSDSRLGLRENMFDHLDDGDLARAIAYSNKKEMLSARYRGVPHRLQFNPLPWSLAGDGTESAPAATMNDPSAGIVLIAFRDRSMVQAIVARAFVVTLVPALIIISLLGLSLWAFGAVSERWHGGATRWLWPHGGLAPMYKVVAVSVGVVIVLFALTTELLTGVWPYLLLPACAALPGIAVYGRASWHVAPRRALKSYGWYTGELTLLALAMLVVPASAIMNLTLGHEFGGLIESEQARMTAQSFDAPLALKAEAGMLKYPDTVGDEIAAAHARRQRPASDGTTLLASPVVPKPFDAGLTALGAGDQRLIAAHEWVDQKLPADSPLLARLRYVGGHSRYTPPGQSRSALVVRGDGRDRHHRAAGGVDSLERPASARRRRDPGRPRARQRGGSPLEGSPGPPSACARGGHGGGHRQSASARGRERPRGKGADQAGAGNSARDRRGGGVARPRAGRRRIVCQPAPMGAGGRRPQLACRAALAFCRAGHCRRVRRHAAWPAVGVGGRDWQRGRARDRAGSSCATWRSPG